MYVVEIIPFKNFKERLQLMKQLDKIQKCNIEVCQNYICVEKSTFSRG